MSDNPTGLKPTPQGTWLSKKPLFFAATVGAIMLLIMLYSINGNKKVEREAEQSVVTIETTEEQTKADYGVASLPTPPNEAGTIRAAKSTAAPLLPAKPITVITQRQKTQVEIQHEKELAKVREWKITNQLKALNSPLIEKKITGNESNFSSTLPSTPSASTSGGGGANARFDQLKNQLAKVQNGSATPAQPLKSSSGLTSKPSQWTSQYTREAGAQFELKTGTVIPALMLTGINSQLAGEITGQVSQNIYDTATGQYLIIPQGTRISGNYASDVQVGQERLFVVWKRLVFPDGSSVTLDGLQGVDYAGYTGLKDQVDNHYAKIFGNAIVMSLITGGSAYAIDSLNDNGNNDDRNRRITIQSELGTAVATQLSQTGLALLQRNMNIAPTIKIRPGYRFNVMVVKDMVFDEPYEGWR
ncbi:TrbI/VirB10 family protein [Desulfotalea psychrophila]|uniref:Probable conjugal transfer protein TrbI n=1 Tax=Desulfotalea psychrophila (strain LSv54 / DSM 12343) TaxID=177439 RepID=Q6AIG3_DESPS|nr:TrbI/VirB10 family protein [Desulfotalea psychrophila]CAG37884.1 probable conjugal transfer protein TrbI [Desulfotalea psychrophila LSv54]